MLYTEYILGLGTSPILQTWKGIEDKVQTRETGINEVGIQIETIQMKVTMSLTPKGVQRREHRHAQVTGVD